MGDRTIRSFEDLDAWKVAMDLVVACYGIAGRLRADERYGLSQQIRRAAVSVPSNIAEGHAARAEGILARHLRIALGSLADLHTQLELVVRLDQMSRPELEGAFHQITRTSQLVAGLARRVRARRVTRAVCWILVVLAPALSPLTVLAFG